MEANMKNLFTLFFILLFQPHVPVTMLPANSQLSVVQVLNPETILSVGSDHLKTAVVPSINSPTGDLGPATPDKALTRNEYLQKNIQYKKHDSVAAFIESSPLVAVAVNQNVIKSSRVAPGDHSGERVWLNGLERELSRDQINASKSVLNRIKDLKQDELGQTNTLPVKLSANLGSRENIDTTNNAGRTVRGQILDKDGRDYNNNTVPIKSPHSLNKQTVKDRSHLQIDNDSFPLKARHVNGILWSPELISKCPSGFHGVKQSNPWRNIVENIQVVKMETGCGSMQNRLLTFNDSSKACVRYRLNSDQMQGEIYSYYLGKLLRINYTPDTVMHKVDNTEQWKPVRPGIIASKWSDNKPVIVTKWIPGLEPVYMPDELKDIKRKLHQENYHLDGMTVGQLCDLVQWSDLIVFDYISANLDRVVNNLFNLKWNSKMLEKPIHNLEKVGSKGQYVFIDNESGLFHGYRLLDSYRSYHEQLLNSVCVFRDSTVDALERLYAAGNAGDQLQQLYETSEQYHGLLPRMSAKNKQILQSRIQDVVKHIQRCKHQLPKS